MSFALWLGLMPACLGIAQEHEAALNGRMAEDFRHRTTPVQSATIREYVEQTGMRLQAAFPDVHFSFETVTERIGGHTMEPVGLPGGEIFVPVRLIETARDGAEFAGMLAHAMAHVAAGDMLLRRPGNSISMVTANLSTLGDDVLLPVSILPAHRQKELADDRAAIRAMAAAGYDPEGLARYLGRVQPDNTGTFSPLPAKDVRLAELARAIQALPAKTYDADAG